MYTTQLYEHVVPLWWGDVCTLAHRRVLWGNGHMPRVDLAPPRPLNKTVWMQAMLPYQLARADVALCHFTNSIAPLFSPCPYVVTIHDASLWLYPHYHYSRRLIAMRPFIPIVARRARAVITVSASARDDLIAVLKLPPHKVHVVYEAPAPQFRPLPSGAWESATRRRYALPAHFILYVGTIEPRKNLVRLVRAFARLRQGQVIPHVLVLVGCRGWKDAAVFAEVERLGVNDGVKFLGYVPDEDLVAIYNLADVFVFPSLYEGFGLPVVEAMACGIPVVTSGRGALAEITAGAAEWVDPEDEESIAHGLRRVLSDPDRRAHLQERGWARARQFAWEQTARETVAIYAQVTKLQASSPSPLKADTSYGRYRGVSKSKDRR